jgi:hypothetical protein
VNNVVQRQIYQTFPSEKSHILRLRAVIYASAESVQCNKDVWNTILCSRWSKAGMKDLRDDNCPTTECRWQITGVALPRSVREPECLTPCHLHFVSGGPKPACLIAVKTIPNDHVILKLGTVSKMLRSIRFQRSNR